MIDEATLALPLRIDHYGVGSQTAEEFKLGSRWLIVDADGNFVSLYNVVSALHAAAREREQLRQYWYSPDLHEEICEKLKEQIVAVTAELEQLRGELEKLRKEIVWNESMQSVHMQCIADLRRERDEARDQRDGLMAQVELLAYERDEARTALDMQRQATDAAQSRAEEARRELAEVQS